MRKWFSRLTLNQKLAAAAFVLGLVAIAARPYPGREVEINSRDLASMVARGADHVEVYELADWIIKGQAGFRLVDLRTPAQYAEYHIPGAENAPLVSLADYPLLRNEKIVLYSDGDTHAAQAWLLLEAQGYRGVYVLQGGLKEWIDSVLFPALTENSQQKERDDRVRAISAFFGGKPRAGGGAAAASAVMSMPKVEMPAGAAPVAPVKKKKKEGC